MLTLPIQKKWFDMIGSGEKKEEYRADTSYYRSRFAKYEGQEMTICLRNGYSYSSPSIICKVVPSRKSGGKAEWGANPNEIYWTLRICELCKPEKESPKRREVPSEIVNAAVSIANHSAISKASETVIGNWLRQEGLEGKAVLDTLQRECKETCNPEGFIRYLETVDFEKE